jgi:hypothetical protein
MLKHGRAGVPMEVTLKQQSVVRHVAPLGTLTHYSDSEPTSLLFLLNAASLVEKQQIPILKSTALEDIAKVALNTNQSIIIKFHDEKHMLCKCSVKSTIFYYKSCHQLLASLHFK